MKAFGHGLRFCAPTPIIWATAAAQPVVQPPADPQGVLVRVAAKIAVSRKRIPNFTCVETVTRDYHQPAATLSRAWLGTAGIEKASYQGPDFASSAH
jgi:hypothetical protein